MKNNFYAYEASLSLIQSGNIQEALLILKPALEQYPNHGPLLNLAGACMNALGDNAEAQKYWRQAVVAQPEYVEAYCNLGVALFESGQLDEAESMFFRALELDPESAETNNNLGNLLLKCGRLLEAEAAYRRALSRSPGFVNASNNLGAVLRRLGRLSEAEAAYKNALVAQPDSEMAHSGLGLVLEDLGNLGEAEAAFHHALELNSNSVDCHVNMARVLFRLNRQDEAEKMARRALEINPAQADALLVLGAVLNMHTVGNITKSVAIFRRALNSDSRCLLARSNLAYLSHFGLDDGNEIAADCISLVSPIEAPFLEQQVRHSNAKQPWKRLRIGYVSPDFRDHCQSFFMVPLLRNHDRSVHEIFCYSSVKRPDALTSQLAKLADQWRDVRHLDDDSLAAQIKADEIDILVDLTMHMEGGRPLLFARRPAPVQVAWLAYPGTTGSTAIGYRLTDPWLDPLGKPEADLRYSERSIRLADTFWCYDPLTTDIAVSSLPADQNGWITFGCLNNPQKYTDKMLHLWAMILNRVVNSRLIMLVVTERARVDVCRKLAMHGIDSSRITFVGYQLREEYLRTYHEIDIALDTLPINGHTTSLDALWMGVPVVTVVGATPMSRGGYSLLSNLGMQELAACNDGQFVEIATDLAHDVPRLRKLRSTLRPRMELSPLMDQPRFALAIEQAYRRMWCDWCLSSAGNQAPI